MPSRKAATKCRKQLRKKAALFAAQALQAPWYSGELPSPANGPSLQPVTALVSMETRRRALNVYKRPRPAGGPASRVAPRRSLGRARGGGAFSAYFCPFPTWQARAKSAVRMRSTGLLRATRGLYHVTPRSGRASGGGAKPPPSPAALLPLPPAVAAAALRCPSALLHCVV